jgi:hypothetical protein
MTKKTERLIHLILRLIKVHTVIKTVRYWHKDKEVKESERQQGNKPIQEWDTVFVFAFFTKLQK